MSAADETAPTPRRETEADVGTAARTTAPAADPAAPADPTVTPRPRRRIRPRTLGTWAVLAAAIVGANLVTSAEPRSQIWSPFPVTAALGESGVGRNIAVTVTEARIAGSLQAEGPERWVSGSGTWLVVDISAEAVRTEVAARLGHAELRLGDRRFSASERVPDVDTIRHQPLSVGIPTHGTLVFELPAEATTGDGTLALALNEDTRGDSLIEVPLVLGDLDTVPHLRLEPPVWGTR